MKCRQGFVSNSSSSSFVILSAGDMTLIESGDSEDANSDFCCLPIDEVIRKLNEAKLNGAKTVDIFFGGSYNG